MAITYLMIQGIDKDTICTLIKLFGTEVCQQTIINRWKQYRCSSSISRLFEETEYKKELLRESVLYLNQTESIIPQLDILCFRTLPQINESGQKGSNCIFIY